MNKKRTLAVTSTSVLAASMAQGAVVYTGVNVQLIPDENQVYSYPFDLDGDATIDFVAAFHNHNQNKPYIECRPSDLPVGISSTLGWTLSNNHVNSGNSAYWGAAVTPFGTAIDATYATTNAPKKTAYLYQDYDSQTLGDWPINEVTDAFVGLAIIDDVNSTTNFGYAHLILNGATSPKTLTLVGYGYETQAGKGILAGAQVTPAEPLIYTQPVSQTVGGGAPVQFKVQALADPTPTYQWQAGAVGSGIYTNLNNNGHIAGADAAQLQIDAATLADNLDYRVIVSNALGSATSSPPATLTVLPPVASGPTPSEAQIFLGQKAQFDIAVTSGVATGFQWRKGGVNLSDDAKYSGASSSRLIISNLTAADNGNFDVVITGVGGSSTSSVATLTTVLTNGGAFEAATLTNAPKSYYRLNETTDVTPGNATAYDNTGGRNGSYGTAVQNGSPANNIAGPRSADGFPGFHSTNYAVRTLKNDANGAIKTAPWNLNTNTVTISAWIKPLSEPAQGDGVVMMRNLQTTNVCGIAFYGGFASPPPYGLGYNWQDQAHAYFWNSGIYPPINVWSFIALVVTPTNATIYMINNDQLSVAVHDVPADPGIHVAQFADGPGDNSVYLGGNTLSTTGGNNFDGLIDEVSVFNHSLSTDELIALYSAARGIAIPPKIQIATVGSDIVLTWPSGALLEATDLTGPWTPNAATSPYTNTPTGAQKFYRLAP